jgi:hypothetical protein
LDSNGQKPPGEIAEMKFPKNFLAEKAFDEEISETIIDHRRWVVVYEVIFKHQGKFYRTRFERGATEYQNQAPYEYEPDEIECQEVSPEKRTITVYEPV